MKNIENKNTMYNQVRISGSAEIDKESLLCSEQLHKTNFRIPKEHWNCLCASMSVSMSAPVCVQVCVIERMEEKGRERRAKNRNLRRRPRFCLARGRREARRSSLKGGAGRLCCLGGALGPWRCPPTPCCPWAQTLGAQRCCWEIREPETETRD